MYALITIAIESGDMLRVPMPGTQQRTIAEMIYILAMLLEEGGGSIKVTETIIRESK